jgi:hypothetical protein
VAFYSDKDLLLTWREPRRVTKSLTVQYDRVIYLLEDTPANRRLVHRYIDIRVYPDGRIEVRADGIALPCVPYDRLAEIDQGAVIEHKRRLGHALQVAQALQAQRDDRRISGSPSRTNRGVAPRAKDRLPGTKKPREFTRSDLDQAIVQIAQPSRAPSTPGQRSARTH